MRHWWCAVAPYRRRRPLDGSEDQLRAVTLWGATTSRRFYELPVPTAKGTGIEPTITRARDDRDPALLEDRFQPEIEGYKLKRLADGVGKVTVNTELNVLSATLTYARTILRLACSNPKIVRFKVRRKKGKVQFYGRREVEFILAACEDKAPLFTTLFLFLFETGARKSEAINLPWSNVLFEQRIIRIWSEVDDDDDAQDEEDVYLVKSREREVPMSDNLARRLAELKLKGLSKEWVFPVVTGRMKTKGEQYAEFQSNTWDRVLVRATELAKKEDPDARPIKGGPHRARHTYASHFLAKKPDLFLLSQLLGHSHGRVTELYAHLIPEHLAEARNVVTFSPAKPLVKAAAPEEPSLDRPRGAGG